MMKNALLITALVLALTACSLNKRTPDDPDVPLRFDPVLQLPAKAAAGGEFPRDVDFGVCVLSGSIPWLTDTRVSWSGSDWAPVPDALWPPKGKAVSAIAYAPYGAASAAGVGIGIEFTGVDLRSSQEDLLYTEPVTGQDKFHGGIIDLPFRHALCQLDFAVRTNAGPDNEVRLNSIALKSLAMTGDFHSLPEPEWLPSDVFSRLVFFEGSAPVGATNSLIGNTLWVIPQLLDTSVEVGLLYGREGMPLNLESEAFTRRLECGRHYTVSLSFLPESMTIEVDVIDEDLK